ncbi:MAG: flippase [Eubacteriales bacterium]
MGKVKNNFIYNSFYQVLLLIFPLITVPYISRVIGPTGVGIHSYTYSIANYVYLLGMLGVNNYGNRTIAMTRDDKKELSTNFWGIYYFQLIISLTLASIYFFFVLLIAKGYLIIYLIQTLVIISAAIDINWLFFGLEEFKLTVIRNSFTKILSIVLIFIFVNSKEDLWIYSLIMAGSLVLSQLVIWPFVSKRIYFLNPDWTSIKQHIRPNIVLFIPVIAISIYKVMDKIMLGSIGNVMQVGFYTNAFRIISIPLGFITALGTVMLPRMSNLAAKNNSAESGEVISKSMEFIFFMGSAFMFGIAGIAPEFTPWFFGTDFVESTNLIVGLSSTILIIGWANVIRTQYLIPYKKDKIYIISVSCGALFNFIINITLIPILGAMGAVLGTIVAELIVCVLQTWSVRGILNIRQIISKVVPYIFFGLLMYAVIRMIPILIKTNPILYQILFGAIVYLLFTFVYLVKFRKGPNILNELIKSKGIKF